MTVDRLQGAIVDSEDEVREGLSPLIKGTIRFSCVACYRTMKDAVENVATTASDVMLVDIGLPGMSGIEGIHTLRERFAETPILALTVHAADTVFTPLGVGASRSESKKPPSLLREVRPADRGSYHLTTQETELLKLLVDGHHYKTAAEEMGISVNTISFHLKNIYTKLRVHSKTEAVAKALRERLL